MLYGMEPGNVDAKKIIRKMDLFMRGDTSFGQYEMTVIESDWVRTLKLKAWEIRKDKKNFIKLLARTDLTSFYYFSVT